MYDASVKEPTGIESGDSYQFGNFDECLSAFQHHRDLSERPEDLLDDQPKTAALHSFAGPAFNPQYCLAQVTVQGYSIAALSTRDHEFKVICNLKQSEVTERSIHSLSARSSMLSQSVWEISAESWWQVQKIKRLRIIRNYFQTIASEKTIATPSNLQRSEIFIRLDVFGK